MSGLFSTFNIAKLGMFAQQRSLDVTSHNIANANTPGYSRQRAELQTTRPYCTPGFNSAAGPGQLGTGVEVTSINRVRDSFIDYQVRVENGVSGWYKGRDKFLSEIENIMNEPTDTGISSLIGKFFDGWQQLSKQAETSNARKVLVEQSLALTNELNHTSNQLEKLNQNTQMSIKETIFTVNNMIEQLNSLNQEIIQVNVSGNNPNDLLDKKDLLIDQLSEKFGIQIDKKQYDGTNMTTCTSPVDPSNPNGGIAPTGADGKPMNILQCIEPDKVMRFAYVSNVDKDKKTVTYYVNGDMTSEANKRVIQLNDATVSEEQWKKLEQGRVLMTDKVGNVLTVDASNKLTGKGTWSGTGNELSGVSLADIKQFNPPTGEIKGYQTVQADVDTYKEQLNKLAKAFAFAVNAVHTQNSKFVQSDANFFVNGKDPSKEQEITAGNITINKELIDDPMKISAGAPDSGESNGDRALAIAQLRSRLMEVQNVNSSTTREQFLKIGTPEALFKADPTVSTKINTVASSIEGMTLDNYFKDTVDRLGIQTQEAKRMVKNQQVLLSGITESKDSISGVSLDEEMANLVQFQHGYQANAKIISTIDQLLDVVVNGLVR